MNGRGRVKVTYVGPCRRFVNRELGLDLRRGESRAVSEVVAAVLEAWPEKFKVEQLVMEEPKRRRKERVGGVDNTYPTV
jgi:hypothetical protein